MISRYKQRQFCVQAIYAWQVSGVVHRNLYKNFLWITKVKKEDIKYTITLFDATVKNKEKIDALWDPITHKKNIIIEIEKAIIRVAVAEMFFVDVYVESATIIDEFVKVAQLFSSDKSYRFVNRILDILKDKRDNYYGENA